MVIMSKKLLNVVLFLYFQLYVYFVYLIHDNITKESEIAANNDESNEEDNSKIVDIDDLKD